MSTGSAEGRMWGFLVARHPEVDVSKLELKGRLRRERPKGPMGGKLEGPKGPKWRWKSRRRSGGG